jgi:hypothetical protein
VQETLGGIGIDQSRGKVQRGRRIGIGARASFANFSIGAGFSFGVEENVPGGPFALRSQHQPRPMYDVPGCNVQGGCSIASALKNMLVDHFRRGYAMGARLRRRRAYGRLN